MSRIVDELVTRYTLDAKGYAAGAQKVERATRQVSDAFRTASMYVMGAGALATGIGYLGYTAMRQAAAFDTLERAMGGAFGSMSKGKKTMAELETYATKSAFGLNDLARAATALAMGGLSVQTYLPIIERFAIAVSKGIDPQGLEEVVGALLRIKGGQFGEAMEIFRRGGIGTQEWGSVGLKFSKANQFMGSPDEFLRGVLQLGGGKVKDVADAITGGAENTFSNAGDAFDKMVRRVGKALNEKFLPFVADATDAIAQLTEDGVVGAVIDSFLSLATISGGGLKDAFRELAVYIGAVPIAIRNIFGYWANVSENRRNTRVRDPLLGPGADIGGGAGGENPWPIVFGLEESRRNIELAEEKAANERKWAAFEKSDETEQKRLDQESKLTDAVDRNTEVQQKQLDLRRQMLGGGALASEAVSPVRLGQMRRNDRLSKAVDLIAEYVGMAIVEHRVSAARAGR